MNGEVDEVDDPNMRADSIKYAYTSGWAHLLAVADRVAVLAHEGKLDPAHRDRIHADLRDVFAALDRFNAEWRPDHDDDDPDYSDGSPV